MPQGHTQVWHGSEILGHHSVVTSRELGEEDLMVSQIQRMLLQTC